MKEILITSSALILALLALRRVFQKTLSRRWQYALWALVLARLLIPNGLFSAPAAHFSVLTATAPVQQVVDKRLETMVYAVPTQHYSNTPVQPGHEPIIDRTVHSVPGHPEEPTYYSGGVVVDAKGTTHYFFMLPWSELLPILWKIGMALMGTFFLLSNLAFYLRLRRGRQIWDAAPYGVKRKVYLVPDGAIPSPCLFGRSIYLTPAVAEDESKLRHVLAHESTHAKHLDPVWSLLRCVCLTIYWFDPLVWIAANCSKTDCELACDESVLNALGEQERIGYGETLLSLIPVKKGPANPMLAATTMTAGKKQLKDRITRIAQRPRQVVAAVVAVALLASLAAACTFTRGWSGEADDDPSPTVSQAPEDTAFRALTGEELRWFNEEFFNSSGADQTGEGLSTYNIRNQFANPINLYDSPEDINLYDLFYLEGSFIPDEELSIVWEGSREDIPCPAYKLTAEGMSAILEYYTGRKLSETRRAGLDGLVYSKEHDAYYWMHGDTNYCGELQFPVGTREGSTVKLYHNSSFAGKSWYCVTLADQGDGRYWFRSNQKCEKPAIATPLPAGEPALTISLDALEPYTTHAVALEHRPESDFPGGYENRLDNWNFDGHHVMAYKTTDGLTRAALVREDGSFDVFLTTDSEQYDSMFFFHDLFGHDGFYVDHTSSTRNFPQRNYYYFTSDGVLTLLAEATTAFPGGAFQLDLDGDGADELVTDNSFFFQRGGNIYEANLPALVQQADPTLSYWDWAQWSVYSKCCTAAGLKDVEPYDPATWQRYFYFDGKNLLAYKDEKPTADHMVIGIDQFVPQTVVEKAKEYALGTVEKQSDGTYLDAGWQDRPEEYRPTYDDWRVESFHGPYNYTFGDVTVKAWGFNYERHTTTPEKVVLAGGTYIDEEHWVSPGYPNCDYLFFQVEGEKYTFLWHEMNNDMGMDSKRFLEHVEQQLLNLGFDVPEATAAQSAAAQLNRLIDRSGGLVTLRLAPANGEAVAYTAHPDRWNAPNYQRTFTDTEYYRWSFAESVSGYPEGTSLTISDPSWEYYIRLWEGSDLVMIKPDNGGAYWYQVEPAVTDPFYPNAFYLMRHWFDEAEVSALRENIAIPDDGRSHAEIAQAWVEEYEGAYLKTTPGSALRWSFMKVTDTEINSELAAHRGLDENTVPFSYSTIFVPESGYGLNWFMAGNTAEYEGGDPQVPKGAFQWWRVGYLHLDSDGYWRCNGTGTGW